MSSKKFVSVWQKFFVPIVLWKSGLLLMLTITYFFTQSRPNYAYTQFTLYTQKIESLSNFVNNSWANFDGIHYVSIAGNGYVDEGRFLPLYPLTIRSMSFWVHPFSALPVVVGQIISFLCLAGFFFTLNKLTFFVKRQTSRSKIMATYLFFPTAFFLGAVYSESLFLFLIATSFYFMQQKQWGRAALFASLSSITRLTGAFVLLTIFIEFWRREKVWQQLKKSTYAILYTVFEFFLAGLPLLAYSYYNFRKWANPLYFITAHSQLSNARSTTALINPVQTIWRYLKILLTFDFKLYEYWIAGLELASFIFLFLLLYLAWKRKMLPPFLLYISLSAILPIFSGTFSGLPRYLLTLFPLLIVLNEYLTEKKLLVAYLATSGLLLASLFVLFARGYYVA